MTTTHQILLVSLLSSASVQAPAQPLAEPLDERPILVRMINSSHLSNGLLRQGAKTARRIFDDAGIATEWVDCTAREREPLQDPRCARRMGVSDIVVRVLAKKQAKRYELPRAALGVAIVPPEGFGALANVFSHRVDELAGTDNAIVMGHILAHEAGHLLLHQPGHSDTGLMQAAWSRAQLRGGGDAELAIHGAGARQAQPQCESAIERLRAI